MRYALLKGILVLGMPFFIFLLSLPTHRSVAQTTATTALAQSIVDSLSAPYFGGRAYGDNGDSLAAVYIESLFQRAGLQPFLTTYQQSFPLRVSFFNTTPILVVNSDTLQPGRDYILSPASPSTALTRTGPATHAGSGLWIPQRGINAYREIDVRNRFVIVNDAPSDSIRTDPSIPTDFLTKSVRTEIAHRAGAKAIFFLSSTPLTYGGHARTQSIPSFTIRDSVWPSAVDRIHVEIDTSVDTLTTTTNVIAYQPGTAHPDRYFVITGHYDHLGQLGPDVYFPGANDNASGIALMVSLANYFNTNPLKHGLLFIAFSGEEQGLLGSRYFVENTPFPLEQIQFLINLDMVASGTKGIMAVGGRDHPAQFEQLTTINDSLKLGPLGQRANAPNSDHYFFLEQNVPGFFLYTNQGTQPYHHIDDIPETIDWHEFNDMFNLVRHFLQKID